MMDEEEVEEEETENHLPPLLTHDEERKEGNSSTFGPLWGRQVFARAVHAWVEGEEEGGREKKKTACRSQSGHCLSRYSSLQLAPHFHQDLFTSDSSPSKPRRSPRAIKRVPPLAQLPPPQLQLAWHHKDRLFSQNYFHGNRTNQLFQADKLIRFEACHGSGSVFVATPFSQTLQPALCPLF